MKGPNPLLFASAPNIRGAGIYTRRYILGVNQYLELNHHRFLRIEAATQGVCYPFLYPKMRQEESEGKCLLKISIRY